MKKSNASNPSSQDAAQPLGKRQCTAVMKGKSGKRCKFDAAPGDLDSLCGHHRADQCRGSNTSTALHLAAGRAEVEELMNSAKSFLPLTSPHVLLSLPTTHVLRVSSYLSRRGLEVVFTEKLRTGHEVKMLVGSPVLTPEAVVSEILAHGPLARILSRPPLVVSASTRGFADVASCFAEACTASQSAGRALKVVGSSKVRKRKRGPGREEHSSLTHYSSQLRAQLLSSPTSGCSPTGEDTFVLDALYGDALYLYGARSSAQSPPPTSPPTFAPRSSEVCKAVYKIEEAFSSRSWGASLENANCLDVGASPGSWTSFLAEKTTGTVLAVDPGDLKPEVLSLPNVSHLRVLASPSTVEELR